MGEKFRLRIAGSPSIWEGVMRPWMLLPMVICFGACAQTASYAPKPLSASYELPNFSRSSTRVVVHDFRAERDNSVELVRVITDQIERAFPRTATSATPHILNVDVIEHRSFFTLGNWNAVTKLKWRVASSGGHLLGEGLANGEGHRSNMAGYLTARHVSQDAFNAAMADLFSSLATVRAL